MPRAVLIGDSIRLGYEGHVRAALGADAVVLSPRDNGGTSANVLAHLDAWAVDPAPDVVHVNCGLHDLRREFGAARRAVEPADYAGNVEAILRRLLDAGIAPIWATTTPVNEAWHHARKGFDRYEGDVTAYNAIAEGVARRLGIPVNDLYDVVMRAGRDALLLPDGVHFRDEGYALLGDAVARAIRRALGI